MKIFSMEKVFPIFQKVFVDQDIRLKHHKELYCEYEEYFLKIKFFGFIFILHHNTFQIIKLEVGSFKICQMSPLEQSK